MKLIFSCGDLNGIGLECFYKSIVEISDKDRFANADLYLAVNKASITSYFDKLSLQYIINDDILIINNIEIKLIECQTETDIKFGKITKESGQLSAESIEYAVEETLNGTYDAIVTLPIAKEAIYLAGWEFPGHTEMLAARCGVDSQIMILATKSVRVALVTVHIPLKEVPIKITKEQIISKAIKLNEILRTSFNIDIPNIAIFGLNPHAGENGNIGKEELEIIQPAIRELTLSGIKANGPFAADGFFAHGEYKKYDGLLAMYHDQGLIPLKLLGNGGGVNFTGGLPIIRTSPDHGTAFDIAGKNIANPQSTIDAIEMAMELIENDRKKS